MPEQLPKTEHPALPPLKSSLNAISEFFDAHPERLEQAFQEENNPSKLHAMMNFYLNNFYLRIPGSRRRAQYERYLKEDEEANAPARAMDQAIQSVGLDMDEIRKEQEGINAIKNDNERRFAQAQLVKKLVVSGVYRALRELGKSHYDIIS